MSVDYSVRLKLESSNVERKLRALQGSTSQFERAMGKAQGNSDKLGKALGGVGTSSTKAANGIRSHHSAGIVCSWFGTS